jgi:hypothetical protein
MNLQTWTAAITSVLGLLTILVVGLSGLLQLLRQMLDELIRVMIKIGELRSAPSRESSSRRRA